MLRSYSVDSCASTSELRISVDNAVLTNITRIRHIVEFLCLYLLTFETSTAVVSNGINRQ